MMMRNILVGYDGSESANEAFDFAYELAQNFGAALHVLAVARPPDYGTEVETEAIVERGRHYFAHILQPLRTRLADGPIAAIFEVAVGHPSEQIVRYAEKHGIDHIVVGHRGHTIFERWLIGSVARQVIAYAPCAVTVVRQRIGKQAQDASP